jgi:hypothetical protein
VAHTKVRTVGVGENEDFCLCVECLQCNHFLHTHVLDFSVADLNYHFSTLTNQISLLQIIATFRKFNMFTMHI